MQGFENGINNIEICRHFYRYYSFDERIDNTTFEEIINILATPIPLIASLYAINGQVEDIQTNDLVFPEP